MKEGNSMAAIAILQLAALLGVPCIGIGYLMDIKWLLIGGVSICLLEVVFCAILKKAVN